MVALWKHIEDMFSKLYNTNITLDRTRCLFGYSKEGDNRTKMNYAIGVTCTLVKHFIHVSKCQGIERSTEGLHEYIKSVMQTERAIASWSNCLTRFNTKWDKLAEILTDMTPKVNAKEL